METVLSRSTKVVLGAQDSGNMIYLPIDKLIEAQRARTAGADRSGTVTASPAPEDESDASRESPRSRSRP